MVRAESSTAANGLKPSTMNTSTNYELPWVEVRTHMI